MHGSHTVLPIVSPYAPRSLRVETELTRMMNTLLLRYGLGKFDFSGAIVSSLADGICAVDNRGRVTFMNAAAERMLIWTEAELLGKNIHKTLHRCKKDEGIPVPAARCGMLVATRSQEPVRCDDDRLRRKDGEMIAVTYTSSPLVVNEQIVGTIFAFRDMTDRERELESLRQSEDQYRSVVEASPDSMWLSDLYGFIILANKRAAEMFGYAAPTEMLHMGSLELIATEDRPRAVQDKRKALGKGVCNDAQYTLLRQDGASFSANVTTALIVGPDKQPKALMSVARDVSHLSMIAPEAPAGTHSGTLEEAVATALKASPTLLDTIPHVLQTLCTSGAWDAGVFWNVDMTQQVLRCRTVWHEHSIDIHGFSALCRQLTIAPGIDLPGRVWNLRSPVWITDITSDAAMLRALMASKEGLQSALCFPVVTGGAVHGIFEFFSRASRPVDHQVMEAMVAVNTQIGSFLERKEAEKAMEYQALHDALTDLPNRVLFQERLQRALGVAHGSRTTLAVFLIDLDRFKQVNDTLGQEQGDQLLKQIGSRLQGLLRDSDTVARLNGDEFAVLLPGTPRNGATVVAQKLLESLRQPVAIGNETVQIGASVGVAAFPEHGGSSQTLMHCADVAMYAAKRAKSGFAVYTVQHEQDDLRDQHESQA